jgi:hypothetical protein
MFVSKPVHLSMVLAIATVVVGGPVHAQYSPAQPSDRVTAPVSAPRPALPVVQPIPRTSFIQKMDEEFRKTDVNKDGQLTRPEVGDRPT